MAAKYRGMRGEITQTLRTPRNATRPVRAFVSEAERTQRAIIKAPPTKPRKEETSLELNVKKLQENCGSAAGKPFQELSRLSENQPLSDGGGGIRSRRMMMVMTADGPGSTLRKMQPVQLPQKPSWSCSTKPPAHAPRPRLRTEDPQAKLRTRSRLLPREILKPAAFERTSGTTKTTTTLKKRNSSCSSPSSRFLHSSFRISLSPGATILQPAARSLQSSPRGLNITQDKKMFNKEIKGRRNIVPNPKKQNQQYVKELQQLREEIAQKNKEVERMTSAGMLLKQLCTTQGEELKALKEAFPALLKEMSELRDTHCKQEKDLDMATQRVVTLLQDEISNLQAKLECLTADLKQARAVSSKLAECLDKAERFSCRSSACCRLDNHLSEAAAAIAPSEAAAAQPYRWRENKLATMLAGDAKLSQQLLPIDTAPLREWCDNSLQESSGPLVDAFKFRVANILRTGSQGASFSTLAQ